MQAIAGSKVGGAESFFVRLVIALNSRNINQKWEVKKWQDWVALNSPIS